MAKNEIIESDDTKIVYKTSFGILTVFKQDESGLNGGKEGTSRMVPEEGQPAPRPIKLKRKYRGQS
tara:strand:+ start:10545 stop:10742 length:198 start_codon:yes stop_codon:yes gene_type:complete